MNALALKARVPRGTVGSNPTPSACDILSSMNRKSLMGVLGIVFLDLGIVLIVNSVLDVIEDR